MKILLVDNNSRSVLSDVSYINVIPRIGDNVKHPDLKNHDNRVVDVEFSYNILTYVTILIMLESH